jgi:hypothetical protein
LWSADAKLVEWNFSTTITAETEEIITNDLTASNGSERLLERHSVVKKTHEVIKAKAVNNNYVFCLSLHNFHARASGHITSNPITGLDRP